MKQQAIRSEVERTIMHYYPERALVSPLQGGRVTWDYDTMFTELKAILAQLKAIDPGMKPGTRGRYDISEEVVLIDTIRVQLSYIGPFAAVNFGVERDLDEDEREIVERVQEVLDDRGLFVLEADDLQQSVPWIQRGTPRGASATVWNCLFVPPEA